MPWPRPSPFIGSGNIGRTLARLAVDADLNAVMSNSRGPRSLADVVAELGDRARAATPAEAAQAADLVVVSLPFHAYEKLPAEALTGNTVIDTMHYFPADGHDRHHGCLPSGQLAALGRHRQIDAGIRGLDGLVAWGCHRRLRLLLVRRPGMRARLVTSRDRWQHRCRGTGTASPTAAQQPHRLPQPPAHRPAARSRRTTGLGTQPRVRRPAHVESGGTSRRPHPPPQRNPTPRGAWMPYAWPQTSAARRTSCGSCAGESVRPSTSCTIPPTTWPPAEPLPGAWASPNRAAHSPCPQPHPTPGATRPTPAPH